MVRSGTWILLGVLTCLIGCAQPAPRVAGGEAQLAGDDTSAGLIDRLASQPDVSENDALHSLLMLAGQEQAGSFQQCVDAAIERRLVAPGWDFAADRPLTKGKLAYMMFQACGLKGGLTLRLTGPSRRYCLQELQYRQMLEPGLVGTPVTGTEFVAALRRIEEHQAGQDL